MANEHQETVPENGIPGAAGVRGRVHAEGRSPEGKSTRRGGSPRPTPQASSLRPEVEEGVVKLPMEQFTSMMGVLLAAMGGAGGGGGTPASFHLGGRAKEARGATRAEWADGRRSEGVLKSPKDAEEDRREKKNQVSPEPARESSSKRGKEARRPGGSDPVGRARRSNVVSLTDQTEKTMPRAGRGEEEVDSYQPPRVPRNGKRRERSEGRSSIPDDRVTRSEGRGEASRQVRELRREMKKLREEALRGTAEAVVKWGTLSRRKSWRRNLHLR